MPNPDAEFAVVFAAEATPVFLIAEQCVPLDLVAKMQCCRAGSEFLEHHQVDPVGVDLERDWKVLPPEIAAQLCSSRANGPMIVTASGLALMSAAESRLVFSFCEAPEAIEPLGMPRQSGSGCPVRIAAPDRDVAVAT